MLSMLLPEDMQLRIALLTVDGRELRTLYEGRRERGPFTLPVTLSELRTGVYLRVLRGGGYRGVTRIVAIKYARPGVPRRKHRRVAVAATRVPACQ